MRRGTAATGHVNLRRTVNNEGWPNDYKWAPPTQSLGLTGFPQLSCQNLAVTVFCTYCSANKDRTPGLLPALERYRSSRIRRVAGAASLARVRFLVLSGRFGLLSPDEPIPWYDHLLEPSEVDELARLAASQLSQAGATLVRYFTESLDNPKLAPYAEVVRKAGVISGTLVEFVEFEEEPNTMSDWRAITVKAEQAKRLLTADRHRGEQQFELLFNQYPGDGMLYLKRAEAFESVGKLEAAAEDYRKAQALLPMAAWKAKAGEGLERCLRLRSAVVTGSTTSTGLAPELFDLLPPALQDVWRSAVASPGLPPSARVALYRAAVERSLEHLLAARAIASPPRAGLLDQIRLLHDSRIIQVSTVSHMHTVRTLGNEAAHGGSIGEDEADACRIAGQAILKAITAALSKGSA